MLTDEPQYFWRLEADLPTEFDVGQDRLNTGRMVPDPLHLYLQKT